jgi:hypothetical protein
MMSIQEISMNKFSPTAMTAAKIFMKGKNLTLAMKM